MTLDLAAGRWLAEPGRSPALTDVTLRCRDDAAPFAVPGPAGTGAGRLALPAPVNAHDHGYGVRTLDFGAGDDALEPWITGLALRPRTDPGLEALVAFGRVAQSGSAGTMHCHNSLNVDRLAAEAAAVVGAARTCGIRLGLSCPVLDASALVYGGIEALALTTGAADLDWARERMPRPAPVGEQIAAVLAIARAHDGPGVSVQIGPIGPQWASDALLEAVAETSAAQGLRVHMHLLESPRQRAWLDRRFPGGVVAHLDRIGFLSPRLAVAHGVQLTPLECETLAARCVILVSNPSANLRLRSGIAPVAAARQAGLALALGLDGTGFGDSQDIWAELRLFDLLHRGRGLRPAHGPAELFRMATETGRTAIGAPAALSDVVVLDDTALTGEAILPGGDPAPAILARATRDMVRDLAVGGRAVLRDGVLTGFDFPAARAELIAQARADAPRLAPLRDAQHRLAGIVRRHYEDVG